MYRAYKDTNLLFKLLPVILIVIFLTMCFSSSVFASNADAGIMPIATVDKFNSETHEYTYTYHSNDKIYTGTFIPPEECYNGTYKSYFFVLAQLGKLYLYGSTNSDYSDFYFFPRSSTTGAYTFRIKLYNSSHSVYTGNFICLQYDNSSGSWTNMPKNNLYDLACLPSGILHYYNCGIYFSPTISTTSEYSSSTTYIPYLNFSFYGSSPEYVYKVDDNLNFDLGSCYPGYTFQASTTDTPEMFVNVKGTDLVSAKLTIKDLSVDNSNLFELNSSTLKSYLVSRNVAIPFSIINNGYKSVYGSDLFVDGHFYDIVFSISCVNHITKKRL